MQGAKLFKKFLMPCGLCAAVPAMKPATPPQDCSNGQCKRLIRPSELPIYSDEGPIHQQSPRTESSFPALEEQVRKIRISVQEVVGQYRHVTDSVTNTIDTGIAHSKSMIENLRHENNLMGRMGAIGGGALTGLVLGIRGGKFKKLLYTTAGAGIMGAVCYPKEAVDGLDLAKHYANISYNFIYGVKPGDEQQLKLELPELPKMPSSFSEFLDLAVDLGTTGVTAVGNLAGTAYKAVTNTQEETKRAGESKKEE